MRRLIREFVEICAATVPIADPVYEFGAFQVAGQEGFADLRPLFPGRRYVGADVRPGPGVDVVLDLHAIALPSDSVGTVLMLDTVEHVEFARTAIGEAHRILRPQGSLILSSVMNFPIHEHPHDFWRFTPQGFRSLLRGFPLSVVEHAGDGTFPHTVVAVGVKGALPETAEQALRRRLAQWRDRWRDPAGSGWGRPLRRLAPPLLMDLVAWLRAGAR